VCEADDPEWPCPNILCFPDPPVPGLECAGEGDEGGCNVCGVCSVGGGVRDNGGGDGSALFKLGLPNQGEELVVVITGVGVERPPLAVVDVGAANELDEPPSAPLMNPFGDAEPRRPWEPKLSGGRVEAAVEAWSIDACDGAGDGDADCL